MFIRKIVGTLTARTAMTSIAGGKKGVKIKDVIDRNFRSVRFIFSLFLANFLFYAFNFKFYLNY